MSTEDELVVRVDPEGVRPWKVWAIGITGVVVILVSLVVVELYRPEEGISLPERLEGVPPSSVAGVRQTLITVDREDERERDRDLARLESWGWVDEESGLVHMPIEAAMELLARPPP